MSGDKTDIVFSSHINNTLLIKILSIIFLNISFSESVLHNGYFMSSLSCLLNLTLYPHYPFFYYYKCYDSLPVFYTLCCILFMNCDIQNKVAFCLIGTNSDCSYCAVITVLVSIDEAVKPEENLFFDSAFCSMFNVFAAMFHFCT